MKLIDLGISKMLEDKGGVTKTKVGTPAYKAPEIYDPEKSAERGYKFLKEDYNTKVDIWSFGCVLYHMLNLHHPFVRNPKRD